MRQINLLPEKLQKAEKARNIKTSIMFTVLPVLFGICIIHFFLSAKVSVLREMVDQPLMLKDTTEVRPIRRQVIRLNNDISKFINQNSDIVGIYSKYFFSTNTLRIIGSVSTNKVWLKALSLDIQEGTCLIEGKSFNTRLVSEFMLELKRLAYFEKVELISMGKESQSEESEIDFKIVCQL